MKSNRLLYVVAAILTSLLITGRASAQDLAQGKVRKMRSVEVSPQPAQPATEQPPGGQPGEPQVPQAVGQDGKPVVAPGQPPSKPGEQPKTESAPKTTPRPAKSAIPPNRDELKVRPDDDAANRQEKHVDHRLRLTGRPSDDPHAGHQARRHRPQVRGHQVPPPQQQQQPGQPGQQRGPQQPNQNGLQLPPPDSVVEIDR